MSLEEIINDYLNRFADVLDGELHFFEAQPSLIEAINKSAMAYGPQGKRFHHQRRITHDALCQSRQALASAKDIIVSCSTFDELYKLVDRLAGIIGGIGELTVYDTALRIGAKLKLEPDVVYLHAGTRKGTEVLGLDAKQNFIDVYKLPVLLQQLRPVHIENLLCIYKDQLGDGFGGQGKEVLIRGC